MKRTERLSPEPEALVAPGEIRELVARLTEQSVDAVPVGVARTLEGVSLETGIPVTRLRETLVQMRREGRFAIPPAAWAAFAALAALGVWAVRHTPGNEVAAPIAPPIVQPAVVDPDLTGTVSLNQVTYGPDGGDLHVDTGFEPTKPLPEGVSVYVTVDRVLWGSGDHRAKVIDKPLSPDDADTVRVDVEELLRYVRQDAARRRLTLGRSVSLTGQTYSGVSGAQVPLPPPGAADDDMAANAGRRAAKNFVESLQSQLRWNENNRRQEGP